MVVSFGVELGTTEGVIVSDILSNDLLISTISDGLGDGTGLSEI